MWKVTHWGVGWLQGKGGGARPSLQNQPPGPFSSKAEMGGRRGGTAVPHKIKGQQGRKQMTLLISFIYFSFPASASAFSPPTHGPRPPPAPLWLMSSRPGAQASLLSRSFAEGGRDNHAGFPRGSAAAGAPHPGRLSCPGGSPARMRLSLDVPPTPTTQPALSQHLLALGAPHTPHPRPWSLSTWTPRWRIF